MSDFKSGAVDIVMLVVMVLVVVALAQILPASITAAGFTGAAATIVGLITMMVPVSVIIVFVMRLIHSIQGGN
jgi:hypothetical protein